MSNRVAHATADSAPPPVVSVNLGYTSTGGGLDGYVTAPFQGYDPAVTGQLTLLLGSTAYLAPAASPDLAPLVHVEAATTVTNATGLIDLAFTTPGQSFGLGDEQASSTDVGISSTTAGLSAILAPLYAAISTTTLGGELLPVIKLGKGLLPGLDAHGGKPTGGSLHAKPYLALTEGVVSSQSVTVLGQTTTTSQSGSLTVDGKTGTLAVRALTDTAGLVSNAGTLLADAQAGNLLGAVGAGAATLASGTAVVGDIGALIAAAPHTPPVLAPVASPALDLNLQTGAGQDFSLGLGSPTTVTETVGVHIVADTFGAYALGNLLGQIVPQLITDLQSQGTVRQPLDVLSQLVSGVSTLAQDAGQGFAGLGGAGAVRSSAHAPDISIQLTLGVSEQQNTALGSVAGTQTFTTGLETNAQGFYDLGTAAQPALTDLLVGLFETPGGREALQIGGDILTQLDQKLGGLGSSVPGSDMLLGWHH